MPWGPCYLKGGEPKKGELRVKEVPLSHWRSPTGLGKKKSPGGGRCTFSAGRFVWKGFGKSPGAYREENHKPETEGVSSIKKGVKEGRAAGSMNRNGETR